MLKKCKSTSKLYLSKVVLEQMSVKIVHLYPELYLPKRQQPVYCKQGTSPPVVVMDIKIQV